MLIILLATIPDMSLPNLLIQVRTLMYDQQFEDEYNDLDFVDFRHCKAIAQNGVSSDRVHQNVNNMAQVTFSGQGPRLIYTVEPMCAKQITDYLNTKASQQFHNFKYKGQLKRQLVDPNRLHHGPSREVEWDFAQPRLLNTGDYNLSYSQNALRGL